MINSDKRDWLTSDSQFQQKATNAMYMLIYGKNTKSIQTMKTKMVIIEIHVRTCIKILR